MCMISKRVFIYLFIRSKQFISDSCMLSSVTADKNTSSLFRLRYFKTMNFLSEVTYLQHSFLWLCIFLLLFIYTFSSKPEFNVPPGPRGWPILGNLPLLGSHPHQELSKLGKKYGGIFRLVEFAFMFLI